MQGLNTTPVHAHTALLRRLRLLSLGLMLLLLRLLGAQRPWREGLLRYSFWALNVGLVLDGRALAAPDRLSQTWACVEHGLWYARSAEFLQLPLIERLRWMRMAGDLVFLSGVGALAWFVLGLWTGWSYQPAPVEAAGEPAAQRA
jgi:nitric oxide reductase subunit B